MQLGKLDEAVVELKKAVALRPDNGDAWAILGSTLKQDSRLREAREALEKAIPLLPGQPGPRVTLAGVLAEQAGTSVLSAEAAEAAGDQQKADQLRGADEGSSQPGGGYRRQEAADPGRRRRHRQKRQLRAQCGQPADAARPDRRRHCALPGVGCGRSHLRRRARQLAIAYERQGRADEAAAERTKAADLGKAQ